MYAFTGQNLIHHVSCSKRIEAAGTGRAAVPRQRRSFSLSKGSGLSEDSRGFSRFQDPASSLRRGSIQVCMHVLGLDRCRLT